MTDHGAISDYLTAKYGTEPDGLIWIGGESDGWAGRPFESVAAAAAYAVQLDGRGGMGVYDRCTTLRDVPQKRDLKTRQRLDPPEPGGRGYAEDSATVYSFQLDGDIDGPGHEPKKLPLPKDFGELEKILIKAGLPLDYNLMHSGGGLYVRYDLAAPVSLRDDAALAEVQALWSALGKHVVASAASLGLHIDNVSELARVFRIPGTMNRKPKMVEAIGEQPCRMLRTTATRYTLDDLRSWLPTLDDLLAETAGGEAPKLGQPGTRGGEREHEHDAEYMRRKISEHLDYIRTGTVREGRRGMYDVINEAAIMLGHAIPCGFLTEQAARELLEAACTTMWGSYNHDDEVQIKSGLAKGQVDGAWTLKPTTGQAGSTGREDLNVGNAAESFDWLIENTGAGKLAGLFKRGQANTVVYVAAVGEDGYVPPKNPADDDGPAQVHAVDSGVLASSVQLDWRCFRWVKDPEGGKDAPPVQQAALFPEAAARLALKAPAVARMTKLRRLKGVVHSPIVRRDGSLLEAPGYDAASCLLHLPDPGFTVPAIPDAPTRADAQQAAMLLLYMVSGFPFVTPADRSNYLGMLLTPLLRDRLRPEARKLFFINAHQAGSGKTLLAKVQKIVHGGVFKSEMPEDEAETRKWVSTVLMTTTAPIVVIDNVTGIVRSSTLAGLATSYEWDDRELGTNRQARCTNDRLWVMTGNNAKIGGDMARRTVFCSIDPGRPHPELRRPDEFSIPNLEEWVTANRGPILAAMLTMIRAWIVAGGPDAPDYTRTTDSYAEWLTVVNGVLAYAAVPGGFDSTPEDKEEGVDDAEWSDLLEVAEGLFGTEGFLVADLLDRMHLPTQLTGSLANPLRTVPAEDVLPPLLFDQALKNSAGLLGIKRQLGNWIGNREGRWAGKLCFRKVGKGRGGMVWRIERSAH